MARAIQRGLSDGMKKSAAWNIVSTYEAMLKVQGAAYTAKHYLAVGTNREQLNRRALASAYKLLKRAQPDSLSDEVKL